jgi:hypothetical protein
MGILPMCGAKGQFSGIESCATTTGGTPCHPLTPRTSRPIDTLNESSAGARFPACQNS